MSVSITELLWQAKPRGQTIPPKIKFALPLFSMAICHALALVIFDVFIILVRPGCDMGELFVYLVQGVLQIYGVVFIQVFMLVYGCLDWFSIRDRCLSLSLIGSHIQAAIFFGYFVGDCFLSLCFMHQLGLLRFSRLLFCSLFMF